MLKDENEMVTSIATRKSKIAALYVQDISLGKGLWGKVKKNSLMSNAMNALYRVLYR